MDPSPNKNRREALRSLGSIVFLTAVVPKALAQGTPGGGRNPTCVEDDVYCGLITGGGTGSGHQSDQDCGPGGSDQDCGYKTSHYVTYGHQDNDCGSASVSYEGEDADCGIWSAPYAAHSDSDCGKANSSGGFNDDQDCGKFSDPLHSWTDQDCATNSDSSLGTCWLLDIFGTPEDPDPPWFACGLQDNPPPPGYH